MVIFVKSAEREVPYGTPHFSFILLNIHIYGKEFLIWNHLSFILLKKYMYIEERFHIIPILFSLVLVVVAIVVVVVNLGSETSVCC